jgi:meiotic recombination protein SPO11
MYALVDYDPDGISIMRTYRTGSKSLGHEEDITTPELQWLGIRSQHILPIRQEMDEAAHSQPSQSSSNGSNQSSQTLSRHSSFARSVSGGSFNAFSQVAEGNNQIEPSHSQQPTHVRSTPQESLTPLTTRDRKAAVNLLKGICDEGDMDAEEMEQVREIQVMLMLNIKAEIQAVDNLGDMTDWLDRELCV